MTEVPDWLLDALDRVPGLDAGVSRFTKGPAFFSAGREVLHFHGPEAIDLRLTRRVIRELPADPGVRSRGSSDWAELDLDPERVDWLVELVRRAVAANRR